MKRRYLFPVLFAQYSAYLKSSSLASHKGNAWKGAGPGFRITSSPTVPSSLLGIRQSTFPRVLDIWNLENFTSTEHEKYISRASLSERTNNKE